MAALGHVRDGMRLGLGTGSTAAFFVAIFPGNISQYVTRTDAFGLTSDGARLVRLFFQPALVAWALWSTGAWRVWRAARRRQPTPRFAPLRRPV